MPDDKKTVNLGKSASGKGMSEAEAYANRQAAKEARRALWPAEVRQLRNYGRDMVLRNFIALKHEGKQYRLEIRSHKGGNFYVMDEQNRVVKGNSRLQVQARYIQLIDPEVEVVKDVHGNRLA